MIKTEQLTKIFGDNTAVSNLNLDIPSGELFAFIGPNGAGKSTTIKLLVGLLIPSGGRAVIGDYDIREDPVEAKRLIGYIPDFPYLYEKLTGREFMRFVGQIYGLPSSVMEDAIDYYLDLFDLPTISRDLIIDEPMVGLDPRTARLIKDILKNKCREGFTVFMSTHTLAVAEEIANRVGIIHEGELIACGSLEELRRKSGVDGRLEEVFLKLTEEGDEEVIST